MYIYIYIYTQVALDVRQVALDEWFPPMAAGLLPGQEGHDLYIYMYVYIHIFRTVKGLFTHLDFPYCFANNAPTDIVLLSVGVNEKQTAAGSQFRGCLGMPRLVWSMPRCLAPPPHMNHRWNRSPRPKPETFS